MNFLAHLYLSGDDSEIRLGNFIGDYVKGKKLDNYSTKVQTGIRLHRSIDFFTDKHQSTHNCIELLRPGYQKYSGVVLDVIFDHILAVRWHEFSQRDLKDFTRTFYFQMLQQYFQLPLTVKKFLPFMIYSNRLLSYSNLSGLKKALEIMSVNTSLPNNGKFAIDIVQSNFNFLSDNFTALFSELNHLVKTEYNINLAHHTYPNRVSKE